MMDLSIIEGFKCPIQARQGAVMLGPLKRTDDETLVLLYRVLFDQTY